MLTDLGDDDDGETSESRKIDNFMVCFGGVEIRSPFTDIYLNCLLINTLFLLCNRRSMSIKQES